MGWMFSGLDRDDFDKQYSDSALFKRIIKYFKPYKFLLLILSLTLMLASLSTTLVPVLISEALGTLDRNNLFSTSIIWLIVLLLIFSIFSFIFNLIQQEFTFRATAGAVYDLRVDVFNALIKKDMEFFDRQESGKLASRVVNDTNDFGQTVSLISNVIGQLLTIFFLFFFLIVYSVKLTLFIILFIPLIVLVALSFRKFVRKISLASSRVLAKVNALIQETTSGIYIAKSFRAENYIYDEFEKLNKTSYNVNLRRALLWNSIYPILGVFTAIATMGIIYLGFHDILGQSFTIFSTTIKPDYITVAELYLFYTALNFFFQPLLQISAFWSQFQQGLAAAERIFALIDAENNVIQNDDRSINSPKGKVEFRDVTFAYKTGVNIFENFNLTIAPGEKLAIVGHTGAGKSSLAKLITRSYEFQKGEIVIDDYDIRSLDLDGYRKNLAIITQEVFLWNDTIRNNLLYGLKDKSKDSNTLLQDVLSKIEVLDWITSLDKGLETTIGERGSKLSMGQRQLLSFARILLQNPSILIMDEATASIDPLTELKIQYATDILMQGRTSIIVAHRLSTIKKADRIIVIDKGRIVEEGTHDDLLAKNGYYAELYNTYYRHQSLEYIETMANV